MSLTGVFLCALVWCGIFKNYPRIIKNFKYLRHFLLRILKNLLLL